MANYKNMDVASYAEAAVGKTGIASEIMAGNMDVASYAGAAVGKTGIADTAGGTAVVGKAGIAAIKAPAGPQL